MNKKKFLLLIFLGSLISSLVGALPQAREDARVQKIYEHFGPKLLWVFEGKWTACAQKLLATLSRVEEEGLWQENYDPFLDHLKTVDLGMEEGKEEADALLTLAALRYIAEMRGKRIDPHAIDKTIFEKPPPIDETELLKTYLSSPETCDWIQDISPKCPDYERLKKLLARYRHNKNMEHTVSSSSNLEEQWQSIQGRLLEEYGEVTYLSWLKPLCVVDQLKDCIRLAAPNAFMRDWVKSNYAERVKNIFQSVNHHISHLDVITNEVVSTKSSHTAPSSLDISSVGSSLDPRFTFDNFVVGKPNELAHAAARKVAESTTVTFNPLFLYGGVGLGKTHLMHAIAWHITRSHPKRKVLYMSAEKFMYQFVRALRFKDTVAFKDYFRSVDVLMIDDVQFISGKESTQEEFFHTFNALVDQNRQIIVSADKSPSDLEGMEERLKSRLGWGLVADIHPTTYELRLGILQSKADQADVTVPQKVLEFLAHKISSNIRELEGALTRVIAHATLVGREITLESTHDVLRDLLRANDRLVTVEDIQRKVAEYYGIRISDMHSPRRARAVARPRQVAMYLAKILTSRSLPEVGRKFGGRDHTTILHAIRKIEELMTQDKQVCEDIELLTRMLET